MVHSVQRAVPWVAACLGTQDPATLLLTSAHKYGHLRGDNSHDLEFGILEYGTVETTAFTELARAPVPAAGVHLVTNGDVERSHRMRDFMTPHYGFADEIRVIYREGTRAWGTMSLFRGSDDDPFDADDVEFLASLSPILALGVRSGILSRLAAPAAAPDAGPAVLIVGSDDRIQQLTPGAEARLSELDWGRAAVEPMSTVYSLVGMARRFGDGESVSPPRGRIRTARGQWLMLHAAPLSSSSERRGDVVVTIEEARPPEIVDLVVAAFDLTARERDVTRLVLQGVDTKEIAAGMHVSTYTVQDHLKSIFDKAGVRSRRELVGRVYFDQYVPRMGTQLDPSGWFSSPTS
ncbi:LuxR family transcriptional regulator [Homoserinibacter sp. GY 40078]|nr:LuxR family transcriptional regulator [Homoserinibacter sp. GY 40078]